MSVIMPENVQALLLTGFGVTLTSEDSALAGLSLRSDQAIAFFVLTRQQLFNLARECDKFAEAMPKPS